MVEFGGIRSYMLLLKPPFLCALVEYGRVWSSMVEYGVNALTLAARSYTLLLSTVEYIRVW